VKKDCPLKSPASLILGVESTIFGLKYNRKKEYISRRFRTIEIVVIGYPLDEHRILEKVPMSGIQNFLFIMFKISNNVLKTV